MEQWGFYFDQSRCVGCKTCMTSCKNWNELRRGDAKLNVLVLDMQSPEQNPQDEYQISVNGAEPGKNYINPDTDANNYELYRKFYMKENWRRVETYDRGGIRLNADNTFSSTFDRRYMSLSCNHCDNPACLTACPMGVISKDRETGIVLVASDACISCGRCRQACPWDAPQYYDEDYALYAQGDPRRPKMTKCTMCYDRINKGWKTACAAACWNRALDAGPISELREKYGDKLTEAPQEFRKNAAMGPNIIFKSK